MKIALTIVGVLLVLVGGLWILQGTNVLAGSGMSGQMQWAINGGVALVVGVIMLVAAYRPGGPKSGS